MLQLRQYTGKQKVSYLREGDVAHAGEMESIDVVMQSFSKDKDHNILDVGCGLGGTANYIQSNEWGAVTGIDIEEQSILYAKQNYPDLDFYCVDATQVDKTLKNKTFDIIVLFNVYYAFYDQLKTLKALSKITVTGHVENASGALLSGYNGLVYPTVFDKRKTRHLF